MNQLPDTTKMLSSLLRRVDAVCLRIEDEWQAGQRPEIEPVLAAFPEPGREELLAELLLLEWTYRHHREESVDPEEYGQRFEPLRAVVRQAWQQWVERSPGSWTINTRHSGPGAQNPAGEARSFDHENAQPVGRGGMGEVHKAFDPRLKRWVALKQIRLEQVSPDRLARFRREAEALARLQHPHIVKAHGYAERDGQPALEMEYVTGGTLEDRLGHHPLEPVEAARLVAILAWAVHAAHEKGIVHRDLKPGNVLMDDPVAGDPGNVLGGFPKISDFGLATLADRSSGQTYSGAVLGTPAYMSPEQAAGKTREVGAATDVWALGVILYRCLAGTLPFQGDSVLDTLERVKTMQMRPLQDACSEVPVELEEACMACLRKDPGARPTAAELAAQMDRFSAGTPRRRAPSLPQRASRGSLEMPAPAEGRSPFPVAARTSAPGSEVGQARTAGSGAQRRNSTRETATVQIVLDREFKDFKREDQDELLEGFRRILCVVGEIKVISVRPGSVILTLQLDAEDAQRLLEAAREGRLAEFRLVSATAVETTAPVPDAGNQPTVQSADTLVKPASGLGWRVGRQAWWVVVAGLVGVVASLVIVGVWLATRGQPASPEGSPQHKKPWIDPEQVSPVVGPAESRLLSQTELYERLLQSVCWIITTTTQSGGTASWTGSGTLIDRDERLVLTTEHVAPERVQTLTVLFPLFQDSKLVTANEAYWAAFKAGKGIKAKLVRVDRKRDLALIQLERLPEGLLPARLASRQVRPTQKIHAIGGSPRGNQGQWIYSPGTVRQVAFEEWKYDDGFPRSADVIASDMSINQGDSGGGVVDDHGRLVGVNSTLSKGGRSNSRHINLNEVTDFIASYFRATGKPWAPPADEPDPGADENVAKLLADLNGTDNAARKKAVQGLSRLGSDARKAIPDLLKLLRNRGEPDDLRDAAAEALTSIGTPGREQVAPVADALRDKDVVEARRYAADVLGPIAAKAPDAVDALVMALKDKDEKVRCNAARSLGIAGAVARDKAQPELVTLLRAPEKSVRLAALKTLSQYPRPDNIDVPREKTILADRSTTTEARMYACAMLSFAGEDVAPAISEVLTTDTDTDLALTVVDVLRNLKVKRKEVGLALSRVLDHKEKVVRHEAARTLRDLGFDPTLMVAFLKALSSPDVEVRLIAAQNLPSLSTFQKESPALNLNKDALDGIKDALASTESLARGVAAYALGSLGEEGAGGVAALRAAMVKETDSRVKLEMLAAFTPIGPAAMRELADKGDDLLEELLGIATDRGDATRLLQTCAAISLCKIAPTSRQEARALSIVARALMVQDIPFPASPEAPRNTPAPAATLLLKQIELELHERAKKILVKGGRQAAQAVAQTYSTSFMYGARDTTQMVLDKAYARKCTFEVLGAIGPDANIPQVQMIITRVLAGAKAKNGQELPEVLQAAKEARLAISARRKK